MAFEDDFDTDINGNITHVSGTTKYPVIDLHRYLGKLGDDPQASGTDLVDITTQTPSARSTDQIIDLLGPFNINDTAAQFLYGGSIRQGSGDTETLYSGLQVLGAVNNTATQVEVAQSGAMYDAPTPFWGDQTTPFNGSVVDGILLRILVKSREFGVDIDAKKIRVQIRHWGDSYDFFNVTLGEGESVGAVGSTPDAQNTTNQGTVTAYTHVTNVEGYQTIDLGAGAGATPYYSKWTYGADTSGDQLKGVWEFIKDLIGNGTAKTIHGLNGEHFLGITHQWDYDAGSGQAEDDILAWGWTFPISTVTGVFTLGMPVKGATSGFTGEVVYIDGSTTLGVAVHSGTPQTAEVVENIGATIFGTIGTLETINSAGGTAVILADDATDTVWVQLLSGSAPPDNQILHIQGKTAANQITVNGTPTLRTVPKTFLGSYTGSLIGSIGVGIDAGDLLSTDSVRDLLNAPQTPPNNVTFTIDGVVSGDDYILVGPKDTGNAIEFDQLTLLTSLLAAGQTAIVCTSAIPIDTPATGTVRVQLDTGIYRKVAYTSYTSATFTTASTDWSGANNATNPRNIFVSYIDELAGAGSVAFTTIFNSPRTLWLRGRFGDVPSPIKTWEVQGTLGTNGGTATMSRIADY